MRMKLAACVLSLAALATCSKPVEQQDLTPQAVAADVATESGEWVLYGQDGGEQRHSPLTRINKENVSELGLAFSYEGFIVRGRTLRGTQATPLMEDGVLYFTGPWSVVYAVDAVTGEELWVHDPEVAGAHARSTCCDAINRGVALSGDQIFVGTLDGYLVSLDKTTGAENWRVDTFTDRSRPYSITGAPRLAGDVVVIGNGGAELGVRGYVTAYDIKTGEQRWRFFTVPSAGEDETIDITRARETWSDNVKWDYGGGGTVWDSMVYDEEQNIIFIGTGNGSPWTSWDRNNEKPFYDNLYISSIVALDADTGLAKWHYQTTPGDSWDYTATQHIILADIEWKGEPRKVLMQAPKNGFFYVIDRVSGELLSAENYVPVTWASHVDLETGRPVYLENADYSEQSRLISPSPAGGHNWPPMAYNPDTGLVYIPSLEAPLRFDRIKPGAQKHQNNTRNALADVYFPDPEKDADLLKDAPPFKIGGKVKAWDPAKGEARWVGEELPFWTGGILSTAGGLVVSGGPGGVLYFYDAKTGEVLHKIETGIMITAAPMSYEIDGEQYIAVLAGAGGIASLSHVPGYATLEYENSEKLFVFKLGGGDVPLPPARQWPEKEAIPEGLPTDPEIIAHGKAKYERFCVMCHTPRGAPNNYPNLWNLSPETDAIFDEIVLGGAFEYAGMASFADVLDEADSLAIRAYLAADRRAMLDEPEETAPSVGLH